MTTVQSGFADLNGTTFYYEVAGTGQPLVLVHAGICDARMWDEQFACFAQHYRVVRYDMRGFGQTALVEGDYAHHQDLCALLDHLGIEQTAILGCSLGGTTAIDFALSYPNRMRALIPVCCEPSGFADPVEDPLPEGWDDFIAAHKAGDLAYMAEYEVRLWVDGPHRTPAQVEAAVRDQVRAMNLIALTNEATGLGTRHRLTPPAFGRLHEIQAPTLVIVGDLDQGSMVRAADVMATQIAGAQKRVIAGTAHLPNLEQPQRFNELVLDFLNSAYKESLR